MKIGDYSRVWTDFAVPGALRAYGTRHMRSSPGRSRKDGGAHGPCQIAPSDECVFNTAPGELKLLQADGALVVFDRPFNFLGSFNAGFPHLDLRAPWLKQLQLRDRSSIKHFSQYEDGVYRLDKVEDLNGNELRFLRSNRGLLERIESFDGLSLVFTNDSRGYRIATRLIGTDRSASALARYAYDERGRMTEADCVSGPSLRYRWHPERDHLLAWRDATGRSEMHLTHDDDGRVVHVRSTGMWNNDRVRYDPVARETTHLPAGEEKLARHFRHDASGSISHEIDAVGGITQHTFDAAGFRTAMIDANGNASSTTYDIRGNIKRRVDAEGHGTTYGWGPHGELDVVIDGAGHIRKYDNDEKGNRLAETDAEGHTTRYIRDERGRLLRTILPDGAEESRAYDAYGRLTSLTDARGGVTRLAHDGFGRVVETTDPLGHVTRIEYAAGAGGFATPSAIVQPDGVRLSRAYTKDGVLASLTDGEGRTWAYTYGAFDVLQVIEDPKGGRLSFAHDGESRVTAATNQMGVTHHLIRDAAGRVIAEEDFDGRRTEYTRDPGGRVIEMKKPDGVRLAYSYDCTDKLASVKGFAADDPGNTNPLEATHYWYDGRGLLIRASNQAALVEFLRDGNGRIVSESVNGRSVESKLDVRGNRIERRIGRGEVGEGLVRYARDPLGMVASITIDEHAPLVFVRDALGRETSRASSEGFRFDQSWDAVGQVVTQSAGRGGPAAVALGGVASAPPLPDRAAGRHYAWDKAGAPVGIEDLIWGEAHYTYDRNGQVAEASFGDRFTERFEFDAAKSIAGVRLGGQKIDPGLRGLLSWQSTPGGVVQSARGPNGETIALTYDVCGRVIERRVDRKGFRAKIWRYGWDALDRLATCETPDGDTWFYRYDPFGRRLTKVRKLSEKELAWTAQKHPAFVPAAARQATKIWTWPEPPSGTGTGDDGRLPVVGTHFLWDGDVVAEEAPLRLDGTIDWLDATRWHFEPESFRPLARQARADLLFFIVNDHRGTPREMLDEAGHLEWAASYTTSGTILSEKVAPEPEDHASRAIYPRAPPRSTLASGLSSGSRSDCSLRFQGRWSDDENGLNYDLHGYYDPLVGKYLKLDLFGGEEGAYSQADSPISSAPSRRDRLFDRMDRWPASPCQEPMTVAFGLNELRPTTSLAALYSLLRRSR